MNKPLSESDLATPKVTTGPIAAREKFTRRPTRRPSCACRCARFR